MSGVWLLVSGFWCLVSVVWCLASDFWFLVSGSGFRVSGFWFRVSGFWVGVEGLGEEGARPRLLSVESHIETFVIHKLSSRKFATHDDLFQ